MRFITCRVLGFGGRAWTPAVLKKLKFLRKFHPKGLGIGPKVVPFGGSYLEFYKVIPKRNYFGAYG